MTGFRRAPLFALIALLAVLTRGLVPAGWMPLAGGDGAMRIVICTGEGAHAAVLSADGKAGKAPVHAPRGNPCEFAGPVAPPLPMAVAFIPVLLAFTLLAFAPLRRRDAAAARRTLWPPAQGPPLPA